jgi:hypothetical protein
MSAVERELVLRLASLLWRLRRATAIESGLFLAQVNRGIGLRSKKTDIDAASSPTMPHALVKLTPERKTKPPQAAMSALPCGVTIMRCEVRTSKKGCGVVISATCQPSARCVSSASCQSWARSLGWTQ